MKGVKEYFLEKERELHKRIEVGEVSRMRYEQLESEAQEKASAAGHERQRERQELTELRDQITDIEKSYSNQIKNTEMRAGDAIVSLELRTWIIQVIISMHSFIYCSTRQ